MSDRNDEVALLAPLAQFWAEPAQLLSAAHTGPTVAVSTVELVSPVLPGARVFCIRLNYLDHAAEGALRDQQLPPYPTLFVRWTQSLTVDGAEVPIPASEKGLDWEGRGARLGWSSAG